MAVKLEFTSLIIPLHRIDEVLGEEEFTTSVKSVWSEVSWHDDHLLREGAMSSFDIDTMVADWEVRGLTAVAEEAGQKVWADMCVVDYYAGPTFDCPWLCFDPEDHTVWLTGTEKGEIVGPRGRALQENPILLHSSAGTGAVEGDPDSPVRQPDGTSAAELPAPRVESWISYFEADEYEKSIGGWGGWFNGEEKGQRWKDFIEAVEPIKRPYYEAVREAAILHGLRFSGSIHQQSENGAPLFDDDTVGQFTMRAWGDLMAAIWSEEDDEDYSYMDFYT